MSICRPGPTFAIAKSDGVICAEKMAYASALFSSGKRNFNPHCPTKSHISRAKSAMAIPCGQPNQPDTRTHARSKE